MVSLMKLGKYYKLAIAILLTELIGGGIGSVFTLSSISTWYASLNKPSFTPPGAVIGIVWTALYFIMGVALWLVWEHMPKSRNAIILYSSQLALNVLWSFLFFYLRSPLYGLVGIAFLWVAVAATMASFYKISKSAAGLFVPYILWVSFAAYLNYSVFLLNH
jgi:tryptophan-rich sensory protein